jgi:hypothetical protein
MTEQVLSASAMDGVELSYPAWLETAHGLLDCTIMRISSAAAHIHVDHGRVIDDEFELWLTRSGACRRRCRLAGRDEGLLTVEFIRETLPAWHLPRVHRI